MKKSSIEALGAIPVEVEIITENAAPVVVHQGVYTLWQKPDGTLRVQYRRDDKEEDDWFELPGMMIKMAKAASEGKMNPMELVKELMKMRP
jgi:hypothetical protein